MTCAYCFVTCTRWYVSSSLLSMICAFWPMHIVLGHVPNVTWHVICEHMHDDLWHVTIKQKLVTCDLWSMNINIWFMHSDMSHITYKKKSMICDYNIYWWIVTCASWSITCTQWYFINFLWSVTCTFWPMIGAYYPMTYTQC